MEYRPFGQTGIAISAVVYGMMMKGKAVPAVRATAHS